MLISTQKYMSRLLSPVLLQNNAVKAPSPYIRVIAKSGFFCFKCIFKLKFPFIKQIDSILTFI